MSKAQLKRGMLVRSRDNQAFLYRITNVSRNGEHVDVRVADECWSYLEYRGMHASTFYPADQGEAQA
jgi:hypothetical protein